MDRIDQIIEEVVTKGIEKKSEELLREAKALVGLFYAARDEYKNKYSGTSEYKSAHLGCRARENGNKSPGISIEWHKNEFYVGKGDGQMKTKSTYIKLPKSGMYKEEKVFDWKTLHWEKELFRTIEPEFVILRQHSKALGEFSKSKKLYINAVKKIEVFSIGDCNEYFNPIEDHFEIKP